MGAKAPLTEDIKMGIMDTIQPDEVYVIELLKSLDLSVIEEVVDGEKALVLNLLYNDLFFDGECGSVRVSSDDLPLLYKMVQAYPSGIGALVWVCMKDHQRPQKKVEEDWKCGKIWSPLLEMLPE